VELLGKVYKKKELYSEAEEEAAGETSQWPAGVLVCKQNATANIQTENQLKMWIIAEILCLTRVVL